MTKTQDRYLTSGQIKQICKKIERHKTALAKHRDELRSLAGDLEALGDTADQAVIDLDGAIDSLSQYV